MKIRTLDEFYRLLNKSKQIDTESLLQKALEQKEFYYESSKYEIEKKKGKRTIYKADRRYDLCMLQDNFKKNFLDKIYVSDAAYGFVKGTSYFDYLEEHKNYYGNSHFIRIDISDFFGSISEDNVRNVLEYYIDYSTKENDAEESNRILQYMCDLVTYNGSLPQGAPCSPVISNIVFRECDIRILKYCEKLGVKYTRYADDLLFSEPVNKKIKLNDNFVRVIKTILSENGYKINYDKLQFSTQYISLNGFVIDSSVHLSRKKMKKIKTMIFYLENREFADTKELINGFNSELGEVVRRVGSCEDIANILLGNRAFLIKAMNYSEETSYQYVLYRKTVDRIQNIIDKIDKIKETELPQKR